MAGTGGHRPGAGRKPKAVTERARELKKNFAHAILSDELEKRMWTQALQSTNEKVSSDALKSLSEFKHGKAKQTLDLDANVNLVARVDVNV
jgi:hypothetical protein